MQPLPLPSTLEGVLELIRELYSPNTPDTISAIQECLHRLQKSDQGWQLAQNLITQQNSNVKFFGALTLCVKLNTESESLSEDDTKELLQNIVGWLLASAYDGTENFVVRKLCSALVTHFIYFSHLWPKCLRQLIYCLDVGRSAPLEALDDALETSAVVGNLDARKMWVAIQFATTLVEEVGKVSMTEAKNFKLHERLEGNAPDLIPLLDRGLAAGTTEACSAISLNCYQAWILYAQRANSTTLTEPLRLLIEPAMRCFPNEALFQETASLFTDVLQNYSYFFTDVHYNTLFSLFNSTWAARLYDQLREDTDDQDGKSFGLLFLAYGDARVHQLMQNTDEGSQRLLDRLAGLLGANGYLVGEDSIFVPALEFWCTFVETMIDASAEEDAQSWRPFADKHVENVVISCWRKVQWPPAEKFAEWDSTERTSFCDARKDVADILQAIFSLRGMALVSFFIDLLLQAIQTQAWAEVEASAFALSALADCVTDDASNYQEFSRIFSPPFFDMLGEVRGPIPLRLRQTGLSLLERYCEYFEKHSEYLPHALNLLFGAVGDPALGGMSSKSISTLCSSCRLILTGETEAFIRHYQTIRSSQALDPIAEEKIVHAISCIIQSIPQEDARLSMFETLYQFFRQDIERAALLKAQPQILNLSDPNFSRGLESTNGTQPVPSSEEIALQIALRALRCLASMAKGLQDTKDNIDLEAENAPVSVDARLASVHADIIRVMVGAQTTFSDSGEVVETICHIFRAGFPEVAPGPFVFPPEMVLEYIIQQSFATPSIGTLVSTACSFVGSIYRGPRAQVPGHLARLLPWVINILQSLPDPESDVEISQNGIGLVDRIMGKYPEVVFGLQPSHMLEFFFIFTLKVLAGKEPLPKGAAADFWSGFIALKPDDPALRTTVANAMAHLGPLFARTLVQNIGGNAARSELDKLSDPLKKLVTNQPAAQAWLEQALFDESFPSTLVTAEDKMVFLKKIIGLRGARQTNHLIREFWLSCRGSRFAYAS